MPFPGIDRFSICMKPLSQRPNKVVFARDRVTLKQLPRQFDEKEKNILEETIAQIRTARQKGKSVMLTFGAHCIKNCLSPVLIALLKEKWVTHLATNGAGIIHDWELAFQGQTSEDVRKNVAHGEFGNWEETGFNINLAINVGAFEGKGYGESVGSCIVKEGLKIPSQQQLENKIHEGIQSDPQLSAAAADLLYIVRRFDLKPGFLKIPHPFKEFSVQAAAFAAGVPFTGHPMFGHDIIYNHPMNLGAAIGRTAQRDFLTFAQGVSNLSDGGIYISVGSAVMSPMIFEKSVSLAQNIALQKGDTFSGHSILVVDLAKSSWDWKKGEPPPDAPDYYHRFCKSFARMGGTLNYLSTDNRDFLLALYQGLQK